MRLLGNSSPVGKSLNHLIVWAQTVTKYVMVYLMVALFFTIISVVLILLCPLLLILHPARERHSSGQIPKLKTRAYTSMEHLEIVRQQGFHGSSEYP